jgi:hypothetical protein
MYEESVIRKTGQWWKLILAFGGILAGGVLMFGGQLMLASTQKAIFPIIAGVFLGIASFIYGCFAIRCPNCGARWVWLGISGKSPGRWLDWLLNQSSCPKCKGADVGE